MRAILPVGKYTIVDWDGQNMKIAMGGSTTMTVSLTNGEMYDIRVGDVLTFYTEVLLRRLQ